MEGNRDGTLVITRLAGAGFNPPEAEVNDLRREAKALRTDIKAAQANYRDKTLSLPQVCLLYTSRCV